MSGGELDSLLGSPQVGATCVPDARMVASDLPESNPVADGDETDPPEFNPRNFGNTLEREANP